MLDTSTRLARPRYLHTEGDVAVWQTLEAAIRQVREAVAERFLEHDINAELDATIRDELIPRALADQKRQLPSGTKLPPFAAEVLFSIMRGYAELDPLFLDPEVTE